MSLLCFLTPGQPGAQCPRGAATLGSNIWGTAVQDPATVSQTMDTPFTLPLLTFAALAHVKCCEACSSAVGNNTAFLCHPGGLKELNQLAELVAALAPPSLWGREASGYVAICLVLGFIPGFTALPRVPSTRCPPPSNVRVLARRWVYSVLSPAEPFIFVQHFFVVLVMQTNSLLNQRLFISRKASQFRTSSAALLPSGENAEDGKIKKMNQAISLWKAKQALRWSECIYLGAGLCILRSCYWKWESGTGISFLPYWKDSGYYDICHIHLTDLQENYVLGVSHRQ